MKFLLVFLTYFLSVNVHAQVSATTAVETVEFSPSNKFGGDFRFRHQELNDNQTDQRRTHRIMLRVGQVFFIQPDLKFTYRLMTGSSANSGNTAIGEKDTTQGSPRYTIGLDQAFVTYVAEKDLGIHLGKMPQFFLTAGKNQVLLDRDITPEGLGIQYKKSFLNETLDGIFNAGTFGVRERYDSTAGDQTDSFLNVGQILASYKFNSELSLNAGLGLFNFTAIKNNKPGDLTVPSSTDFKGNSSVSGNYKYNYEMNQQVLELKWNKKPFDVLLFAEHIENIAADTDNEANIYGVGFGFDKFNINYARHTVEADAIMAVYTSSDYAKGETNSRGNVLQLGYKLNKNAAVNYSLYDFERNVSTTATDYKIAHIDLTVVF
jgi:hypothetical protein